MKVSMTNKEEYNVSDLLGDISREKQDPAT
jgi:hypothetical protein